METQEREVDEQAGGHEDECCSICLESLQSHGPVGTLPCLHNFHASCLAALRSKPLRQSCPLCRSPLPPGPPELHMMASRIYFPLKARVEARAQEKEGAWENLNEEEQREMDRVVKLWRRAGEQGHTISQCNLGFVYRKGRGVQCDEEESVRWYSLAAANGNANAMCNLGLAYYCGKGVEGGLSEATAAHWYRLSALQGFATAQFNLGLMCSQGTPAAVLGDRTATPGSRGDYLLSGEAAYRDFIEKADEEAFRWYALAAAQGHADAQVNLGSLHYQGRGCSLRGRNLEEALRWFGEAAAQGQMDALCNLGLMYQHGEGQPGGRPNEEAAVMLLARAADLGHTTAAFTLGAIHQRRAMRATSLLNGTSNSNSTTNSSTSATTTNSSGGGGGGGGLEVLQGHKSKGVAAAPTSVVSAAHRLEVPVRGAGTGDGRKRPALSPQRIPEDESCASSTSAAPASSSSFLPPAPWGSSSSEGEEEEAKQQQPAPRAQVVTTELGEFALTETQVPPAAEVVRAEEAEAAKWFEVAAELGHPHAQHNMGVLKHGGRGTPQSSPAARKWYWRAVRQGHLDAMVNLALMLETAAYENNPEKANEATAGGSMEDDGEWESLRTEAHLRGAQLLFSLAGRRSDSEAAEEAARLDKKLGRMSPEDEQNVFAVLNQHQGSVVVPEPSAHVVHEE